MLDNYLGKYKWAVVVAFVMLIIVLASCSAVTPMANVSGLANMIPSANMPASTNDAGVGASVGAFTWVGALMMLAGMASMVIGFVDKKTSITCLVTGIGIAGTPLLLAYVGQTILQWTAAGCALCGLSIVACMAYRRWKRVLNGNGQNT